MSVNRSMALADCIATGINTRDLCGNEQQAIKQEADDHSVRLTEAEWEYVLKTVNQAWVAAQDAAGVDPAKRLNGWDRQQVEKDLAPMW